MPAALVTTWATANLRSKELSLVSRAPLAVSYSPK